MKYAIFFAGSGQRVNDPSLIYTAWAKKLKSQGYATLLLDGVGEFDKTKNWIQRKLTASTGKGWATIVQEAMTWLEEEKRVGNTLEKVVIVGMSRGGVQAVVCANCMKNKFKEVPVFLFAVDPVQGWHAQNHGSFDIRDNRTGKRGTRDDLKAKYGLSDDASNSVADNVKFYLSVVMQFKGKNRKVPGFTPQSPLLQNMNVECKYKVYELPGDHSTGVSTGLTSEGTQGKYMNSIATRSYVTSDMFYHHLLEAGFGNVGRCDDFEVFDSYCRIANDDLSGIQIKDKQTGFSFLMASHPGAARRFEADPNSRFHKGRGHLVQSRQVAASKALPPVMQNYYVNERHFKVYQAVAPRLEIEMRKYPQRCALDLSNIVPWLMHGRRDFSNGWDEGA